MLSIPDDQRRQSLTSHSGRRGSYLLDDIPLSRSPRPPPRHKPPLDEATLAARQQYAAHGLMVIMRKKVAKRRRVLREQTMVSDAGEAIEEHSTVVDVAADEHNTDKAPETMNNSYIISAIPYMPKPVAVICLLLNIILPGSGTILSGLTAFCCGKGRMHSRENKSMSVFCVNLMVGIMQFSTVTFLLVGWAWSLVWGIYMIILAEEHHKELLAAHNRDLQAKVIVAMNGRIRTWTILRNKDNS